MQEKLLLIFLLKICFMEMENCHNLVKLLVLTFVFEMVKLFRYVLLVSLQLIGEILLISTCLSCL